MTLIVVSRVTPSLRGALTRWMLELKAGVFVGTLSARVRDRLWNLVVGSKRLGACTLIKRSNNEQGFTIATAGDDTRQTVDFDGLILVRRTDQRTGNRPKTPWKPLGEACGGELSVRGPVEAGTVAREGDHFAHTVEPNGK
jgi:CRISPR-associated protein Cas2